MVADVPFVSLVYTHHHLETTNTISKMRSPEGRKANKYMQRDRNSKKNFKQTSKMLKKYSPKIKKFSYTEKYCHHFLLPPKSKYIVFFLPFSSTSRLIFDLRITPHYTKYNLSVGVWRRPPALSLMFLYALIYTVDLA